MNQLDDPAVVGGDTSGAGSSGAPIAGTLTVSDPDGITNGSLFAAVDGSNGTAAIDPTSGAWIYTPNPGFSGTDSFTVTITDDAGNTATQVVALTVSATPVTGGGGGGGSTVVVPPIVVDTTPVVVIPGSPVGASVTTAPVLSTVANVLAGLSFTGSDLGKTTTFGSAGGGATSDLLNLAPQAFFGLFFPTGTVESGPFGLSTNLFDRGASLVVLADSAFEIAVRSISLDGSVTVMGVTSEENGVRLVNLQSIQQDGATLQIDLIYQSQTIRYQFGIRDLMPMGDFLQGLSSYEGIGQLIGRVFDPLEYLQAE